MKLVNLNQIVSIITEVNTVTLVFSNNEEVLLISKKYNCENDVILQSIINYIKKMDGWANIEYLRELKILDEIIENYFLFLENGYRPELLDQYKL